MTDEKTVGMGIRITERQRVALEKIADRNGLQISQLIRFSIDALLAHYERCGRRLVLPVDFKEEPSDWARAAEKPKTIYGNKKRP